MGILAICVALFFASVNLVLSGLDVRIEPINGKSFTAVFNGITADSLLIERDGQSQSIPLDQVRRLERAADSDDIAPTYSAGLVDGSVLKIEAAVVDKDRVTLKLREQPPFEVTLKQLHWIRFRPPSAEIDEAWLGLLGVRSTNDLLVIRRSATVIDKVPGVVNAIDENSVAFSSGGASVKALVGRLEGVVFAGTAEVQQRTLSVTDTTGSVWALSGFAAAEEPDSIVMVLNSGDRRPLKIESIATIKFADNALRLATERPLEQSFEPLIGSPLSRDLVNQWLAPRGVEDRDLIMRSRSTVSYRVDPQYKQFSTIIVPDEKVAAGTGAAVQVLLDDKIVWESLVIPGEPARGLQLDLNSARRLTFKVDFGTDSAAGDSGDVIRFVEPRLLQ